MPTYSFICNRCEEEFEVIKPVRDFNKPEICSECGLAAQQVMRFNGHISADNGEAYYNYALGKVVRSKNDVRQELSRVKGETGREFIEVGNDKTKPKKRESKITVTDEMIADMKKGLKH